MTGETGQIRFGTDGWRAVIADDFTFEAVRRLAHGLGRYIVADDTRNNAVVIGYDRRFASEVFASDAAGVLASYGLEVHLTDRAIPTQLSSFSARMHDCMAFVVTASHNPWHDNGVKIKERTGAPASDTVLRAIEAQVPAVEPHLEATNPRPEPRDLRPPYRARLAELVDLDAIRSVNTRLVVDALHGCGAGWIEELVSGSGSVQTFSIRDQRDTYFGGVNPEPIMPNVEALCQAVKESGADVGLAFDGDADRVGLVSESGCFIDQLQVYALLYWHLLEDRRLLGPAVYTVSTTEMIPRLARAYGTQAHETPVGFKYVGPKMQETDAIIGGEESGGFGFGFHIPERDGLLAALMLLELRANRGISIDSLVSNLQEQYGPSRYSRVDIRFPRAEYKAVVSTLASFEERLATALHGEPVSETVALSSRDGFKVRFSDGSWLLFRFSGTEPVARVYAEAPSVRRVEELLAKGRSAIPGA
jgi:phosphomannomutase